MKIAVAYNQPDVQLPDQRDVLDEMALVAQALTQLGHTHRLFPLQLAPDALVRSLQELHAYKPDCVFNLVETLGSDPRLAASMAGWWAILGYAHTGSSHEALVTTTDKTLTKALLAQAQIPTPAWQVYTGEPMALRIPGPWLCKPAWEDASVGIHDDSLFHDPQQLMAQLDVLWRRHAGQPLLIETYIDGRELNVSLLAGQGTEPELLPPAELVFQQWPKNKPRLVNYASKWDPRAFEYQHTLRSFAVEPEIAQRAHALARSCWQHFHLQGYARVDFRLNPQGELYVIEINANPCIAPDSGFIAAVVQHGQTPVWAVKQILAAAEATADLQKAGVV